MIDNSKDKSGPTAIKSLVLKDLVCTGAGSLTNTHRDLVSVVTSVNSWNVHGGALRIYVYIDTTQMLYVYWSFEPQKKDKLRR